MAKFFHLQPEESVNVIHMSLPDQLDSVEFDQLNEDFRALLDVRGPKGWVIDFGAVQYMGSAMLGLMVNVRQQVKTHGGQLILCGVSARLHEIIRTCCMDRLFKIAKTRAEAIKLAKAK